MSDLNATILDAHARDDRRALVRLYTKAAEGAEGVDEACFFLTYAYIFALEMAHPAAGDLKTRLIGYGREE